MIHSSGRVAISVLSALGVAGPAWAQSAHAPRICSPSSPLDLAHTPLTSAVSIAVDGTPPTLYVLYSAHDGSGSTSVSLLEISGVNGSDLTIRGTRTIGPGEALSDALAISGGTLLGAFVRPDHHIAVFARRLTGGDPEIHALDASNAPVAATIASLGGHGALVSWGDATGTVRVVPVDAHGQTTGSVRTLTGTYGAPAVAPAFGGTVVFPSAMDRNAHLAVAPPSTITTPVTLSETRAIGSVASVSADGTDTSLAVAYTARDGAHAALLTSADGAGRDRLLGAAGVATETAIASTSWGAFVAWTRDGSIRFMPVASDGSETTGEFFAWTRSGAERARRPTMAAYGNDAFVVWNATGLGAPSGSAIRMERVECQ